MVHSRLYNLLWKNSSLYHPVVPFNQEKDKLLLLDFTAQNNALTNETLADINLFSAYIIQTLKKAKATYGIGGYNEHRTVYSRSNVFNAPGEPRRLHLGVDIWGLAGTPVYAPLGGVVHSFAFNNNFGDYGATIILQHQLDGFTFHTLYGHLSLKDIAGLQEGSYISRGATFARFGEPHENGYWPPHLHFQVIKDMQENRGDYPGVCSFSLREKYLQNCPDPDVILQMMQYATVM